MARSATTSNDVGNVRVKEERVRPTNDRSKGKARAREPTPVDEPQNNDEQDADADQEYEDQNNEGESPRAAKRARVNDDGDSVPSGSQAAAPLPRVQTQPRGDDGYIPGSIVRIQLSNFVTYDYVEFFPGPYLNMIIGPNGTGKSSIACAIALGLNFPPSILGRANEINSFVKHGTSEGYIEIELKGMKNKKNLVVRRKLNSIAKTSSFTINGQGASGREVTTKMAELNVQVGNLCSFLPQDRVTEFAAMSSQELLRQTQLAAGNEHLTNWHNTLIEAGKELKDVQLKIQSEEDAVKQAKERNEGIERDVQKFKERKVIEHQIGLLEVMIPVAEYMELREQYYESKAQKKKALKKVHKLKAHNDPAHMRIKQFERESKDADKERSKHKTVLASKNEKSQEKINLMEKLVVDCQNVDDRLLSLRKEEKSRKQEQKRCEEEILTFGRELEKPRPYDLPDEEEVKAEYSQVQRDSNAYRRDREDIEAQLSDVTQKKAQYQNQLDRAQQELRKQDDDDVKKLNSMQRWDPTTHAAIQWVRQNRGLFKMEVFETPFMRLTVKDNRFTDAVEACFSPNQLKEDLDTLNHHINDQHVLGPRTRINTWYRPRSNHEPTRPLSDDQMYQLGFNAYALDVVSYPQGLDTFLTMDVYLHRTPIALVANESFRLAEANDAMAQEGGGMYIAGQNIHNVSRSRYGRRLTTSSSRQLNRAKNLSTPTVDPELQRRVDADIRAAREGIALCEEARTPLIKRNDELDETRKEIEERQNNIKRSKEKIQTYRSRLASLQTKKTAREQRLKELQNKPTIEQEEKKLQKKLRSYVEHRRELDREVRDLNHAIIRAMRDCTLAGLTFVQASANKDGLQALVDRKDAKYKAALAHYSELNERTEDLKGRSIDAYHRSKAAADKAAEDIQKEYTELQEVRNTYDAAVKAAQASGGPMPAPLEGILVKTSEELLGDLETQNAKLDMNTHTNEGVVRQYEDRVAAIQQMEQNLASKRKKEEKIARDIKNARDNWHPALQKLVNSIGLKFSAAFDKIGCAGEVRISEHEDYDKWAIDILVKFRDSEKLQLLTAHRQSGGERSLTTILYLLSLTEEARAPFSLVDEINQGMDQRAERSVHNSMVGVTCKEEAAQYFLITPKLLPDLEYHERMKILCVNNGEWLPEDSTIGRMSDMLDVYLATRGGAGRASM